jgi:hypothetical protein
MSVRVRLTLPATEKAAIRCTPGRQSEDAGPFSWSPAAAVVLHPGDSIEIVVNMMAAYHVHSLTEGMTCMFTVTVLGGRSAANFVTMRQPYPTGEWVSDRGVDVYVKPDDAPRSILLFNGHALHVHEIPIGG